MKRIFLYFIAGLLLTACSAGQSEPPESPEIYFQEGEAYLEKGLYDDALASWEKVRESFYSPELTMLAELKMAETYYQAERYPEAVSAYSDFLKQNPRDVRNGSVTYWLGMSYYQQILDYDQDQSSTRNALRVFNDLLKLYPDERDAAEIGALIQNCKDQLAAHEVYVGSFYLRTKQYRASVKRLEKVLQQYPDYQHRDEAFFYLLSAYLQQENRSQAEEIFQQLSTAFPNSLYLLKAQKKLKK